MSVLPNILVFQADRGPHLSRKIDADDVIAWGMRVQVDAHAPSLFDDLGLREVHFIVFGRHDAVTALFCLLKRFAETVVKFLRLSEGSNIAHERKIVSDVRAAHLAEHAVEGALFRFCAYRRPPCSGL